LIFRNIEDNSVPAILANQSSIDREQNLLPGTQLMAAVRARIAGLAGYGRRLLMGVAVFNQSPTPVLK
jgi:hypothetical protein